MNRKYSFFDGFLKKILQSSSYLIGELVWISHVLDKTGISLLETLRLELTLRWWLIFKLDWGCKVVEWVLLILEQLNNPLEAILIDDDRKSELICGVNPDFIKALDVFSKWGTRLILKKLVYGYDKVVSGPESGIKF